MSSTLEYTSEVDLENLLLVDIDASFSSTIDEWISVAEEEVNNITGYTTASGFWNESVTNEIAESRVDGEGNLIIFPRKRPINSFSQLEIVKGSTAINIDLTNSAGDTRYVIPATNDRLIYPSYELSLTGSTIIRTWSAIKFSRYFTRIDYIGGYTTLPSPVKLATTLFTADTFMRQSNKEGLMSLSQGRVSKRWAPSDDGGSTFTRRAKKLLIPYIIGSHWV